MSMQGKAVLISGATQGIGKAAAIAIAKMGAQVSIIARDPVRAEVARGEIAAAGGSDNVEVYVGNLASLADIRRVAAEYRAKHQRLDVLINNAGAFFTERHLSPDGYELTFATDHLNYFLLTQELLPLLKASAPARIVNVASDAHRMGITGLDFADLQAEKSFAGFKVYGRAKLANILFTRELARRLQGTGVTANSLHPGVIASGFGKGNSALWDFVFRLGGVFMTTPEKGARTTVYLATSPEVEGVSGQYFAKSKATKPSAAAQDDAAAKKLWDVSEQLVAAKKAAA
jgi:NAD(P)-dependent dehydrogenase (short-subunit alcohol dehydrogenase family)